MSRSLRASLGLALASASSAAGGGDAAALEARRFKSAYSALAARPGDAQARKEYLEAFPVEPRAFTEALPSEPERAEAESRAYVAALAHTGRDHAPEAFAKLLRLAAGLEWDAGAPAGLQQAALKLALSDPGAFAGALGALRAAERQGVAAFLAEGPDGPPEALQGLAAKLTAAGHRPLAGILREEARLAEARQDHL